MSRLALLLLLSCLVGCEEEKVRPPAPPTADASRPIIPPPPPPGPRDSGSADAASDAAVMADAALVFACVEADGEDNAVTVTQDTDPITFPVRAAYAGWADGEGCDTPTLLVGLSDGACEPGIGQQLLFFINRDSIGTEVFPTGPYSLRAAPFDDALSVRFYLPLAGAPPAQWGSCIGATGAIDFDGLDETPGSRLAATFTMSLTDCGLPAVNLPILVEGSFDIVLGSRFEDVCP